MIVANKEILYPIAAAALAVTAAGFDIRSRRIPNLLTGFGFAAGSMLHFRIDGWHGLGGACSAGLIAGGIFLLFFLAGGLGGGDVKLIAAVATMAGMPNLTALLVFTSITGGLMALVLALKHGQLRDSLANAEMLATHHYYQGLTPHPHLNVKNTDTLRLPYAVAIAAGCLVTACLAGVQR